MGRHCHFVWKWDYHTKVYRSPIVKENQCKRFGSNIREGEYATDFMRSLSKMVTFYFKTCCELEYSHPSILFSLLFLHISSYHTLSLN